MQVNMHEAKSQLSNLVDRALAGEQVVIARRGKPAVRLVPINEETSQPIFGALAGILEFDKALFDSMDEEILDMFYGDDGTNIP